MTDNTISSLQILGSFVQPKRVAQDPPANSTNKPPQSWLREFHHRKTRLMSLMSNDTKTSNNCFSAADYVLGLSTRYEVNTARRSQLWKAYTSDAGISILADGDLSSVKNGLRNNQFDLQVGDAIIFYSTLNGRPYFEHVAVVENSGSRPTVFEDKGPHQPTRIIPITEVLNRGSGQAIEGSMVAIVRLQNFNPHIETQFVPIEATLSVEYEYEKY